MKNTAKITLGVLALLAVVAVQAQAQNTCAANPCSLNDTVKVTVSTVLRLTLSQSATALTPPNEAAYDAGFQLDNGPVATGKANRGWTLSQRQCRLVDGSRWCKRDEGGSRLALVDEFGRYLHRSDHQSRDLQLGRNGQCGIGAVGVLQDPLELRE